MSKTLLRRLTSWRPCVVRVLGIGALVACDAACAGGFAAGVGGGLSRGKVDCLASLPCDRSDSAFKVYAGYGFASSLDVRLGYLEGGRYKGADTTPGGTAFGGTFRLTGFSLTAGYLWAFAPAWTLHAQAGAGSVRARFAYDQPYSGAASKTTTQPVAGASLGYAVTSQLRVGLDYDVTRFKAHATHGSLQTLGLSAEYAF